MSLYSHCFGFVQNNLSADSPGIFADPPNNLLVFLINTCYTKKAENDLYTLFHSEWGTFLPQNIREGSMSTYVKLYRALLDHDMLSEDNTAFIVFTKILLRADWKTGTLVTGRFKLGLLTNLRPMTAWDALHRLQTVRVVRLETDSNKTIIHICNWHKYQSEAVSKPSAEFDDDRQQTVTNNNKKRIKNILGSNEPGDKLGNQSINELFQYWKDTTGFEIQARVKANRYACSNLLKKHGLEAVKRFVDGVKKTQHDKFAPRIADFTQLQSKLNELMLWGRRQAPQAAPFIQGQIIKTDKIDKYAHLKDLPRRELNKM